MCLMPDYAWLNTFLWNQIRLHNLPKTHMHTPVITRNLPELEIWIVQNFLNPGNYFWYVRPVKVCFGWDLGFHTTPNIFVNPTIVMLDSNLMTSRTHRQNTVCFYRSIFILSGILSWPKYTILDHVYAGCCRPCATTIIACKSSPVVLSIKLVIYRSQSQNTVCF